VYDSSPRGCLAIDAAMALVDAFGELDAGLLARDTIPYVLPQQDFAELFARQLPDECHSSPG